MYTRCIAGVICIVSIGLGRRVPDRSADTARRTALRRLPGQPGRAARLADGQAWLIRWVIIIDLRYKTAAANPSGKTDLGVDGTGIIGTTGDGGFECLADVLARIVIKKIVQLVRILHQII